jgi:hypothetical protein
MMVPSGQVPESEHTFDAILPLLRWTSSEVAFDDERAVASLFASWAAVILVLSAIVAVLIVVLREQTDDSQALQWPNSHPRASAVTPLSPTRPQRSGADRRNGTELARWPAALPITRITVRGFDGDLLQAMGYQSRPLTGTKQKVKAKIGRSSDRPGREHERCAERLAAFRPDSKRDLNARKNPAQLSFDPSQV